MTVNRDQLRSFLLINAGLVLVAAGIVLFKMPNNFVTGGVSGLAIVLSGLIPGISIVGPFMAAINVLLLILGFRLVGQKFGAWTVYASLALSGMVWLMEALVPLTAPLTSDPLLELLWSIILPGVGTALVFQENASSGGTDILAKILSVKTSLNVGQALFWTDFTVAGGAFLVFGVQTGLYSLLGLILKAVLIDLVIENLNVHKKLEIITSRPEELLEYILRDLKRGATLYPVTGAFTGTAYKMIHTVVSRRQAFLIRRELKTLDPQAFVNIITTSEIIGKGFRNPEN